jgi:ribonuclease BN (tRNA processing enzyme)
MSTLSVRVVGVGDAFTARHYNACLLVEAGTTRLLVDAPPALARALGDLGERGGERIGLGDVDRVLITHLHGDHVGGLEQLLYFHRFVVGRKVALHAAPEVLTGLWETRLKGGMDTLLAPDGTRRSLSLDDYALVSPLEPGENHIGDLAVSWRPTIHHIPTSALRISAFGRTFGYSADTAFDPSLIAWLSASDLFFHETNLGVHTPMEALCSLSAEVRGRMRIIHYPDFHDVDGSPIPCAREGERYTL